MVAVNGALIRVVKAKLARIPLITPLSQKPYSAILYTHLRGSPPAIFRPLHLKDS